MKLIIKYSRHGAVKYISHLDMQRHLRTCGAAGGLPAEYPQGFNPHIIMSFASPLPWATRRKATTLSFPLRGKWTREG